MNEPLVELESQLDKLFGKDSPYQLPTSTKKSLANATWWIILIVGLLQLWAAWGLWQLGHVANTVVDYANYLSATYGDGVSVVRLGFFYYVAFAALLVEAAMLLLAVPALKDFKQQGWRLLYYSVLLNVVYGVVRMFSNAGGGLGQFIIQLFVSAVIAYFVFQVRTYFHPAKHGSSDSPH
jgi:hypothetical protein